MEDLTNEAFNQEKNETLLQDLQAEKSLIIGLTDQSFFLLNQHSIIVDIGTSTA